MKGFCQHCGRELNGDEPYCPECGSPTGFIRPVQPYAAPSSNKVWIWIGVVAVIGVMCFVAALVIPMLLQQDNSTYTVTFTVDEFSITLDDLTQYEGNSTIGDVSLCMAWDDGSGAKDTIIDLYTDYNINSGVKSPSAATYSFDITGNPDNVKYTVFLYFYRDYYGGTEPVPEIIDLYSVDPSKISGSSSYYGCTGVAFNLADFLGSPTQTFTGDSDPIGYVKITITSVKK